MSTHGPIVSSPVQRLVNHKAYVVEMVNSIIKDTDLDECSEDATEDLGVSSRFNLAKVNYVRFTFLFSFLFAYYNCRLLVGNGEDEDSPGHI